ncbi:hypothetical protein, partial [Streptomyces sp. NPDC096068]|uniref:hypothetical protein n=1 Tax=Streptomyces sp. NPDC096068 TaxID=3155424 RepID=UPI003323E020
TVPQRNHRFTGRDDVLGALHERLMGSGHGDTLPLTWTRAVEDGRRVYFCEDCSRANLRAIEGRLDSSWWDAS